MIRALNAVFQPQNHSRLQLLEKRWQQLPEREQTQFQAVGKTFVACGATHGVHEACNFGCTACYLGKKANQQKPMPFEEIAEQLNALRQYLGPGGNVQITSGEVTLLPKKDLINILAYARSIGLSPMVMTHGDVLRLDPQYLDALVTEGGLTKVSIHMDITQRGRKGYRRVDREAALSPLRAEMAEMLKASRKRTGRKLKAATTVTVNKDNLHQLDAVLASFFQHLDAFRILSFQPQAKTGRTKDDKGVSGELVWREVEQWLGISLNPHPLQFGHKDCNKVALLMKVETGADSFMLQVAEPDNKADATMIGRFLRDFRGVIFNDRPLGEMIASCLGVVIRKPWWLGWAASYVISRTWRERRYVARCLKGLFTGKLRLRPCAIVVHAFMDRAELATPAGQERLKACMFKLPVDGEMVSMCEMNGTDIRESTYSV